MQTMKRFLSVFLCILFVLPGFVSLGMTASATEFQVGDLVQIGTYPQTRVTDEELIEALDAQSAAWQSYGYYSGTYKNAYPDSNGCMTASNYMQYADVTYAGDRYRGVKFVQYRPVYTGLVTTAARSGQDENGYFIDTTYWFEWEPLLWRVLDPAVGLVMTESVIDSQPFHNYRKTGGQDDYGYDAHWGDPDRGHYANNYACSDIRAWLTDELDADSFLNTAFTAAQREKITAATLDNSAYRREVSDYGCEATTDKIFLLSWSDVTTKAYGFSVNDASEIYNRLGWGTDYAKCQGLHVNTASGIAFGSSNWLLRTAGDSSKNVCYVTNAGACDVYCVTDSTNYGIRPAMHVDLDYAYATAEYTAKFVADGKTVGKVKYTADTTSIQDKEPAVPAKEGYDGAWPTYTLLVGGITVEAVYTPIEYTATFKADGKVVGTVNYNINTESIKDKEPAVPAKEGYTGAWKPYTLAIGGIIVEAEYEVIGYTATFVADDEVVGTVNYNAQTTSIKDKEPAVPAKEGYTGAWKPYTLEIGGVTVEAEYTPIEYTATFKADDKVVGTVNYTVETASITAPAVPAKEGYTGAWKPYTLTIGGVTVEAEYTPIAYTATFQADGKVVGTVPYTVLTENIKDKEPAVPAKDGYTGAWKPYTLDIGGITVEAEYTAIEYTATFQADGKVVGTVPYTVETKNITEPAVPEKEGYTGAWKPYTLAIGGVTVEAEYTPIAYTATFQADGKVVGTVPYTVETKNITEPAVPAKEGYIGSWKPYTLDIGGITVEAEYEVIGYTATFVADGVIIGTVNYNTETESIKDKEPAVPAKEGYTGAWKPYTLDIGGITVEAEYTAIEYTATFKADGKVVGTVPYTVLTEDIKDKEPAVPAKDGYTGAWKPYTLALGGVIVEAEYTPIEYTATFKADGEVVGTVKYTVETESITAPAVPEKEGYTGAWKPYTLDIGGVTVEAEYTPIEYTATFQADGKVVGTVKYTVETASITAPAVPEKEGYTGAWKPYTLDIGGITVEAEYTAIEYTATFQADGKVVGTVSYTVETASITAPAVPEKEGYTGAWPSYTLAVGGVTVEAAYTAKTYTVTWIVNGTTTKTQAAFGSAIDMPADPTKEGHTFTGWAPEVPDTMPAKDMTFTAQFSANTYNAVVMADGEQIAVIPYTYGQKSVSLPDVPAKEGYTGSWPTYTLPIGGVTITAVYTKNSYTVTWVVDGQKTTASVPFGSAIAKPADPVKSGYQFTGWTPAVPATMPAKDLTFTAQFAQIVITSLRVVKTPNKTVYTYRRDKSVDLTGMVLEATYSDGSKKTVTNMSDVKVTGYSAKPRGDKTVVVEFEGKTAQFTVNVKYTWWQWLIIIFLFGWLWY